MTGTFPALKQLGGHNTVKDLAIGVPALALGGLGVAGGLGGLGLGAADAAAAGGPLDILAGGEAAGTAIPAAVGETVAPTGALASGLATEPGFASSAAGTFAPGLDTAVGGAALPAGSTPTVGSLAPFSGGSPTSPGAGALPFAPQNTATIPGDPTTIGPGSIGPASGSADFGAVSGANADLAAGGPTLLNPSGDTGVLSGITNFFKNNSGLLSLLGLGVGGQLASPFLSKALGLNKVPGSENLNRLAQQEADIASGQAGTGNKLEQSLVTGTLLPGQQQQVTNALNDAIATIKGRYGSLGLSGSSMEAEAIANAQNRTSEIQSEIEARNFQSGAQAIGEATSALGLESSIYNTLLEASIQQDTALGNAISNFASSVGLGTAIKQGGLKVA